ncbi:MAG: agmatine deiminase family protein [Candidatus Omnitrophica bacterium]|nr:agmatine deiminase family protein [Candidatus Omnitrophota bacterium]
MPPEWHAREATWMAWPKESDVWSGGIAEVEAAFLKMIEVLSADEVVHLLVDDAAARRRASGLLRDSDADASKVLFHEVVTRDVWVRDYGPNFLIGTEKARPAKAWNHWRFNAWGNKYPELLPDGEVNAHLAKALPETCFKPGVVLEGGSIDVDGEGLCLTTEQCLLHPNRNGGWTKEQWEECLRDYLGVAGVLWLKGGIAGDDTDGHVDDVARFAGPGLVVAAVEDDPEDDNHLVLTENRLRLGAAKDGVGRELDMITVPMPEPLFDVDRRLPASYLNFYIAPKAVLVPVFGCRQDVKALSTLGSVFRGRKMVGIDARVLVRGMGAVHCVTHEEPSVSAESPTAGKGKG